VPRLLLPLLALVVLATGAGVERWPAELVIVYALVGRRVFRGPILPLRRTLCRRLKAWLDSHSPDSDLWRAVSLLWADTCL
jgi:hypothetical protein